MTKFIPQQKNLNKHSLHGLRLLEKSIQGDGFIDAQTAAADGEIISGSARLELSAEKFSDVEPIIVESDGTRPVIVVRTDIPNASDPRARRLSVAANQIAKTDFNPDGDLLQEWGNEDAAIKAMFAESEWMEITGEEKPTVDAEPQIDRAAELLEKWKVVTGDLWQIGEHRLICGDCTDAAVVARVINNEKIDLNFSDPPYGVERDGGFGGFGGFGTPIARRQYADDWDSERPSKEQFDLMLSSANNSIFWGGNYYADILPQSTHWIVWDKNNTMPTFGDCELAWTSFKRKSVKKYEITYNGLIGKEKERFHPTQKPLNLFQECLNDYSKEGESIIDFYHGSGTTLVACQNLGRRGRAIEISPSYVAVTLQRMADAFPELIIKRIE